MAGVARTGKAKAWNGRKGNKMGNEKRNEAKIAGLADQVRYLEEQLRIAREQLAMVRTPREGVWLWQGDGEDDLQSLSCPVVMSADTLREIHKQNSIAIASAVNSAIRAIKESTANKLAVIGEQAEKLIEQLREPLVMFSVRRMENTDPVFVGDPNCKTCYGTGLNCPGFTRQHQVLESKPCDCTKKAGT